MITILAMIVSVIFIALIIVGFSFFLKSYKSEPLTSEQVKEYREYYEKKAKEEREYYIKHPALADASPAALCNPTISLEPSVNNFISE